MPGTVVNRGLLDKDSRRQSLIANLEQLLNYKVITYVCGDGPLGRALIADDAVPLIYEHLQLLCAGQSRPKVALYLYSRGGATETPWKIATLIREMCDGFITIIPFRAHSATTMIAMSADKILMHEMGELGPVDPSMHLVGKNLASDKERPLPPEIGVEDIAAFLRFIRNRVGLSDQQPLAQLSCTLTEFLSPPLLGRVERVYSHTQVIAAKLLAQHQPPLDQDRMARIVESLTEKCYVHGHAIRRSEAREIGLDVEDLKDEAAQVTWSLYKEYESVMKLRYPNDPINYLGENDATYSEDNVPVAFVESVAAAHAFLGKTVMRRVLTMPTDVKLNLNLSLPPEAIKNQSLDLQKVAQALMPLIQQQVEQQVAKQSPTAKVEQQFHGKWVTLV